MFNVDFNSLSFFFRRNGGRIREIRDSPSILRKPKERTKPTQAQSTSYRQGRVPQRAGVTAPQVSSTTFSKEQDMRESL